MHLDMATINKTRPSCPSVKVQVDLAREMPCGVRGCWWQLKSIKSGENKNLT